MFRGKKQTSKGASIGIENKATGRGGVKPIKTVARGEGNPAKILFGGPSPAAMERAVGESLTVNPLKVNHAYTFSLLLLYIVIFYFTKTC